jgi:predicted nucleotidyltransferase
MAMTLAETNAVTRFKSLLNRRLRRYSLTLFGSRAQGQASPESDLDILVITEEPEDYELLTFIYDCAFEAGIEEGLLLNAVAISRDRWENSPQRSSLLAEAIRREGIPI